MCLLRKASQTLRMTHGCWRRRKSKLIVLRGVKICTLRLAWLRQMCGHGAMRPYQQAAVREAELDPRLAAELLVAVAVVACWEAAVAQALLACPLAAQPQVQPTPVFKQSSSGTTPTWAALITRRSQT